MQLQWLPAVGPLGLRPDLDQQQGVHCYAWCQQECKLYESCISVAGMLYQDLKHAYHRTFKYLLYCQKGISSRLLVLHAVLPFHL